MKHILLGLLVCSGGQRNPRDLCGKEESGYFLALLTFEKEKLIVKNYRGKRNS
jgi:hypothetical protein